MLKVNRAGEDVTQLVVLSEYDDRDRTVFCDATQRIRRMPMDMTQWIEFFTSGLAMQLTERLQETNGSSISSIAVRGWQGTRDHRLPASKSP